MTLPASIEVSTAPDATRLILSARVRTGPQLMALVPILFGVIFSGSAIFWMAGVLRMGNHARKNPPPATHVAVEAPSSKTPAAKPAVPNPQSGAQSPDWFSMVFALFGVPFLVVGLIPIGIGILMFFPSHAEVIVTGTDLVAVEHNGPLRFRRRRPLSGFSVIRVGTLLERSQAGTDPENNFAIFTETPAAAGAAVPPPLRLVQRYPRPLLLAVAEFLVEELKRHGHASLSMAAAAAEPKLTVDPLPTSNGGVEPPPPQPESSKISFIPAPDSVTLIIPRTGFRGAARFFLLFSLAWNTFSFAILGMMLAQLIRKPSPATLGGLSFVLIFVAIGITLFLTAIQSAFRKSVLLATRDSLVFTQTGPLRKLEYQWAPADIASIRCINSSSSVNDRPLKQLSIMPKSSAGAWRRILTGRDEAELRWLASVLRHYYAIADAGA